MSLEEKLFVLTEQVTQLTDAVTVLKNVLLEKNVLQNMTAGMLKREIDLAKVDAATHEAIINEKTEVPNEPPKSSPTTDTSPPSSTESPAVTYDDVKAVTIAVSKIDKAKAIAGLARFGAKNAKELQEKQWSDYVIYMKRVETGEIDPESSHE